MLRFIFRFVIASIALGITALIIPGFSIDSIYKLFIIVLAISLLDFVLYKVLDLHNSRFGRGLTSFLLIAVILYFSQFVIKGIEVNVGSALFAAFVYGIINALLPGKAHFEHNEN